MAAKHRRTKGKDWSESSSDDASDDDDSRIHNKMEKISYVKRELQRKLKKTSNVLSKLCDSDEKSDIEKKKRPSLPIAKKLSKNIYTSESDSLSSDTSHSLKEKSKTLKKNISVTKSLKKKHSESDSDQKSIKKKKHRVTLKEIESNKSKKNTSLKTENDNESDSSSSKEFQKPKTHEKRKSKSRLSIGEEDLGDYTIIETPSKSDADKIQVEAKHEILLKHHIIEEVNKVQKMFEDLKSDLEYKSDYLIKKKVNVLSDSKFIAHYILRIYDNTFKSLKGNRNKFAKTYETWLDTCCSSSSIKSTKLQTPKKRFPLYSDDDDNDDNDNNDDDEENKAIDANSTKKANANGEKSIKLKKKHSGTDTSIENAEQDKDIETKVSSSKEKNDQQRKSKSSRSLEQDESNTTDEATDNEDIQNTDFSLKKKVDHKERRPSNVSSKSLKDIDNLNEPENIETNEKTQNENPKSNNEEEKEDKLNNLDGFHENDDSDKEDTKAKEKSNCKEQRNNSLSLKTDKKYKSNEMNIDKDNEDAEKENLKSKEQNDSQKQKDNSLSSKSSKKSKLNDMVVDEENENIQKQDARTEEEINSSKKKSLSLSKKSDGKSDKALSDLEQSDELNLEEKNNLNTEKSDKASTKSRRSSVKEYSDELTTNLSNVKSNKTSDKPQKKGDENDSTGQVSDCDSEEIFSGDETRPKKKNEKLASTEDLDKTAEKGSDSEDLFESTASEVQNTPIKSPILSIGSKSLRKTLFASKQKELDHSDDNDKSKVVEEEEEEEKENELHLVINSSLETYKQKRSTSPEEEKHSSPEKDKNSSPVEAKASNAGSEDDYDREIKQKLLRDSSSDSPDADSEKSVNSSCSTIVVSKKSRETKKRKSLDASKKHKKLPLQTKKRDSISSDSSSDSSDDEVSRRGKKRRENGEGLPAARKRRRLPAFNVRKNIHYKADEKLRMVCRVKLERLAPSLLVKYTRALEKSKKYVANKKFHSITNLDSLESKKKSKKALEAIEELSDADSATNVKSKKKSKSEKTSVKDYSNDDNDMENVVSDDDMAMDKTNGKETALTDDENIELALTEETESNNVKEALLNSCTSSSNEDDNAMEVGDNESEENKKNPKKSKKENKKNIKNDDSTGELSNGKSEDEENEKKKEKSRWKQDEILTYRMTDTESEEEKFAKSQAKKEAKRAKEEENYKSVDEEKTPSKSPIKRTRKPRKKRRVLDSDSDVKITSDEESNASDKASESEEEKEEKKKKTKRRRKKSSESDTSSSEKKPKSKRRRIKKVASESDSEDGESPGKGRKNIRKVLKDRHVAEDTKKAALDEEERLKRIAERQKLFNEMYDARLAGETKVDKLVLDVDEETKEELVVVHKELVKRLKPHQAKGIKFMWDACFESLKQIEKSEGSGCIIAHCMGLGKTFQVVTLAHTLLCHEETGVRTVMIVCPLSTVLNWVNEFKTWLKHVKDGDEIEIYELTKMKKNIERKYQLESWQKTGGVLIIGYEMFRNLTSTGKKMRKAMQESIMRSLVDPGADLVVCDEGHLLKNEESALSKAMKLVKTRRRIVLTGTPLQNNLKEYHCMVQFVKPNLLGTKKEFLNRFVNPITNGQFDDSTPYDVKLMKKRAHVLHKMLEGSVQRFDYSVLTPFLPPKQEYVIFVRLTEVQIKMYQYYLDNFARRYGGRNGSLFADFQELQRIWTHPYVLRLNAAKIDKANEKKRLEASDSEGSLKDFIDDDSESEMNSSSSSNSGSNSDIQCVDSDAEKPIVKTRSTRLNPKDEPEEIVPTPQETTEESAWWSKFVEEQHFEDLRISTKLVLLFGILKESEQIGDKVLVFSQSLYSLTLIEQFLNLIDQETQNGAEAEHLENHTGTWSLGLDYFRLDGSTSAENRSAWCKIFNNPNNTRARLFLISTRAGGLGINLTAANRVIIFDASWNPSHDVQSIFRIYRFGQKKPCYVYRFLAAGTMEEKIYNRQVTKLSLACRVVDEQQIERHYSNNDLAELYQFESYEDKSITLNLPKDRLLAEIFLKYKDLVYNYHEHDSLLENKEEEELDEEERKQAWLEYEEEKQGKRQMINMGNNMMGNMAFNQMLMNMNSFPELESIKLLIQKDYPNLPPEHLEQVARQAVYDMYRFVDQQAVNQLLNPFAGQSMQPTNMLGAPGIQQMQPQTQYNQQSQLLNMLNQPQMNYPGVNHMPVYSGRGRPPKHLSMNSSMGNMRMQTPMQTSMQAPIQAPMQASMPLPQQAQMQSNSSSDDVQLITDQQVPQPNNTSASNTNNIPEE